MLDILVKGGPVMYVLLFCSILALAVGLERLVVFLRCRINSDELTLEVRRALKHGKVLEAMQMAKRARGPVAAVLAAGIGHYGKSTEEIRLSIEQTGREEIMRMQRRLPILDSIVTIAPLLGLLGTVTGIIKSFNILAALEGAAQPVALSAGIAEALLTTAFGLIIAIPTMAMYTYLEAQVQKTVAEMNRSSLEVLSLLTKGGEPN